MVKGSVFALTVVGILAIVASIYGGIAPPPFLGTSGLLLCGLLFLIGLGCLIGAWGLHHKSKIQTVTINIKGQAEKDAAALTKMEYAVERGESAETVVPEQKKEKLVVPPEVFATLKKEQAVYAKQPKQKKEKNKPVKLSSEILKLAKRKAKKKKK